MTVSERLFKRFCERREILCLRLQETHSKTPDYEISIVGGLMSVEIKQLEPNAEDRKVLNRALNGEPAGFWVDMHRPHHAILDGTKQLRAHAKGRQPAMVVLYAVSDLLGHLDADSVAQCLYGPKQVHIAVPHDGGQEPWVLGASHGGGRVATPDHNTTLSAVGVLRAFGDNDSLSVFHNAFASRPLDPARFRHPGVQHFHWRASGADLLPRWVENQNGAA